MSTMLVTVFVLHFSEVNYSYYGIYGYEWHQIALFGDDLCVYFSLSVVF